MNSLSHFDETGQAHMVDVGAKPETRRVATARGHLDMQPETFAVMQSGRAGKGDVLGIARIAAIQGAKHTAQLIPLCHPLALTRIEVVFHPEQALARLGIEVRAETVGRTGVEMEALTAVSAGLLTVYDMLKAIDRGMKIGGIALVAKSGGASGDWQADTADSADPGAR